MIGRTNAGGSGGASLNFKIIAYTTETALLAATPAENTIGVVTGSKITSYVFAASEPAELVQGLVWVKTGTASSVAFNAAKKGTVMVYPSACYQYEGGTWVSKPAKIYKDGAWKDWAVYLYNAGDPCADLTGGWVASALKKAAGGSAKAPTITEGATTLTMVGNVQNGGTVHTANKIDLTAGNTLRFVGTLKPASNTGFWATICVWSEFGSTYQDNLAAYYDATDEVSGEVSIDISSLSGEYYVGFALYGSSSAEMSAMVIE